MKKWRGKKLLTVLATLVAGGCAGDGCGGCVTPTPGGFPPDERIANGGQLRLTSSAIDALEADPAALLSSFLGSDQFDVPPVCGGDDPYVCCTEGGGQPLPPPCGPIRVDLVRQGGDSPRLVITPENSARTLHVTARARISTVNPLPIEYSGANCDIDVVTDGNGDLDDVTLQLDLVFSQHPESGTTRLDVGAVDFTGLENDDVEINGGVACFLADVFLKGFIVDQVTGVVEGLVGDMLVEQLCNQCPGGSVEECSAFADACEGGVCMNGDACEQQLGLAGRLSAGAVLGGFSSGQAGAMDIYEVAGGYATTNGGGIALGILGGMLPAGAERDRCGPAAEPPAAVDVAPSAAFAGNTRPDNGQPYGVGLGLHQHEIDQLSWAAYESGFWCANIGTPTVSLLNSDALSLVIRSLPNLLHGRTSPLFIGLRPQAPPVVQIGPNTFVDDGSGEMVIDQPLLDVSLEQAELDVYVMVDDQYIRIMTIVADVHLPIGMEVDPDGALLPIIGAVDDALSNLSVKNSEALLETPEELAETLPAIINVALPALGGALGPIELPALGPLAIRVLPGGITSVEENAFLAIYGDVALAAAAARTRPARVDTSARIAEVRAPDGAALAAGARPAIELELGGGAAARLEHSYRIDGGSWSPYTAARRVTLSRPWLELPGRHRIEVRAREIGRPLTGDRTPRVLEVSLYAAPGVPARAGDGRVTAPVVQFHGQGQSGCDCRAGGGSGAGLALLVLAVLVGLRRRSGALLLAIVAALSPACSCGSDDVECNGPDGECMEGEVPRGPTGRWSSLDMDGDRLVAAAYEESLGDLVFIEVGDDLAQEVEVVDGIPDGTLPTYAGGYRGGVVEAGPDVGAYTSIKLRDGNALIAYHDLDDKRLKLARQDGDGWNVSEVDVDPFGLARIGLYASLAITPEGRPAIAYLAVGVDDGSGGRLAQLRYALASDGAPSQNGDWVISVVDERLISCAGLCGEGKVCVPMGAEERCATPSSDCPEECGEGAACVGGTCTAVVADPAAYDIPNGVGLFASQLLLPDGRPVIVYYDRNGGDLFLAESVNGTWEIDSLDAAGGADTGMWCDALIDGEGTVHVAYQDAVGDRLLYTSWSGGTAGAVELIDDGVRAGETRTHPV
ncbi:MAG TPA: MYXO-CTERM sorting domain-containing protein, partial [Kofleriaceae bacterium]|nr:MYXO-CTERM sorting domain-containing protein [Kofleriaceae bacterium]